MSDLPAGWEWATFGDVAQVASNLVDPADFLDAPHIAPNHIESGTGRLLEFATVRSDGVKSAKHRFFSGQILYSKIRPYLAKAALANFDGLCSADMYPVDTALQPSYLKWWMLSDVFTESASRRQARSVLPKINAEALRRLSVPVPPLAEQQRILDEMDAALSSIEAGAASLRHAQLRIAGVEQRVVADALTGGDAPRRGSAEPPPPPDGVPVHDGDLPPLPAHWRWARLHQIADVVGGVTKDAAKQSDPAVPLVPYLRVANVQRGHLDLDRVSEIRVAAAKVEKLALQPGDVLLNEGGDRDKLGRGWIWEGQIECCIHQNHVFRARIRDNALHPKLLAWHANGFGHWFEVNGKQSVNLASISLRTIKQLPVPVPPPDEQRGIVRGVEDRLAEFARLRAALQAAQAQVQALRRSILADAFAGRLVPQDPSDEPAATLLARIRAGRAAQPVSGRQGVRRASR